MAIDQVEIQRALDEEDVEGLLELGAPADEYEAEAGLIAGALFKIPSHELTEDRLKAVVVSVWSEMFGPFPEQELAKRMPAFSRIAEKIAQSA